jgi:phosphoglycolate phosphatase
MKKAIIFDLDGTLLDTIYDIHQAVNFGLQAYGYEVVSLNHVRQSVGSGAMQMIQKCAPKASQIHVKTIHDTYQAYYDANHKDLTVVYEGITQLLQTLRVKFKLAVVSNKYHHLVQSLTDHYFKDTFDSVLGMTDMYPIKPAPDMILHVCNQLNITTQDVLYIGDSEPDILVAKTLNLDHIAVSYGYRTQEQLHLLDPMYLVKDVKTLQNVMTALL